MESHQRKSEDDIVTHEKTAKHRESTNNNRSVGVLASAHPLPPFFTLNLDCCDEIFDLLPLTDLHSLGQTCKLMQRVTGEYFQNNYRASKISIKHNGFRFGTINLIGFSHFVEKVWMDGGIEDFQFAGKHCNNGKIKEIYFDLFALNEAKIDCIKGMLANLEIVLLTDCIIPGDFYEIFLKFCPKLRRLSVLCYEGFQNQWLLQKYPTLEYLKLAGQVPFSFGDIQRFFTNNSNVRHFAIDGQYLFANQHLIIDAKIKWHDLIASLESNYAENMIEFSNLFMKLHEAGVYQRLHLFLNGKQWDESFFQQLARVPTIVNLCLDYFSTELKLQILNDLKKFEVFRPLNVTINELQQFAQNSLKLERIVFREASSTEILPFVCLTKQLKEIRVCWLKRGKYFDRYLDLAKLNCEREKLISARKIIIYVEERVYLATKKAIRKIRYSLIEMRRISSYQDQSFYATFV